MNATPSSTRKLNLSFRLFLWAYTAILEKSPTINYKALLRKLNLLVDLVRLIAKVTATDTNTQYTQNY